MNELPVITSISLCPPILHTVISRPFPRGLVTVVFFLTVVSNKLGFVLSRGYLGERHSQRSPPFQCLIISLFITCDQITKAKGDIFVFLFCITRLPVPIYILVTTDWLCCFNKSPESLSDLMPQKYISHTHYMPSTSQNRAVLHTATHEHRLTEAPPSGTLLSSKRGGRRCRIVRGLFTASA